MPVITYIIEDEAAIRIVLTEALMQNGYKVQSFSEPSMFINKKLKSKPQSVEIRSTEIILSDLYMPGMNGIEFIKHQIKSGRNINNMAIMSGLLNEEDQNEIEILGIKFFSKPFKFRELMGWLGKF